MAAFAWSFTVALIIAYPLTLAWIYRKWSEVPLLQTSSSYEPSAKISVIVPARNEAVHLSACLEHLSNQTYPASLYEIIVIDDFSTDHTASIAEAFSTCKLLQLADFHQEKELRAHKKAALATAIQHSTGELIVTTDADCIMGTNWLRSLAFHYEKSDAIAFAAPVLFHQEESAFERFQSLDYIGMMAVTAAGIQTGAYHMCNGANFAYARHAYERVNGFSGIDRIATGDDMLLLQKIATAFPDRVQFVKHPDAVVNSYAQQEISGFWRQRMRWASKTAYYKNWYIWSIQLLVLIDCIAIVGSLLFAVILSSPLLFTVFACLLVSKTITDYLFLKKLSSYFSRSDLIQFYPLSQLMHIMYISLVGLGSLFVKKVQWKGRRN